ncbi:MAG TPA: KH domain-containing protein [Clostridia bacterium]|jgi:predicted RNA-binding protein YlqC (UPF0109 family)|nr:KH domain-containing protein [Clostridiaceae bacterium]HOA32478.1 KH domain-containing protein [Clostridia bacterium]HPZ53029.1 KH domain-containing protein [Clostridia bacterium]
MKELLVYIARQLVDNTDAVSVNQIETEKAITLQLSVAEEDMGKVIGKDGRIAKAIRTVIKAASRNEDKPVYVDIV